MAELTVPQIDFSTLGNLGNVYKQAQADNLRQQTLASLGQGGTADAAALLKSGDLSLAQLGIGLQNTQYQHGRDDKNDTRQAAQDAIANSHWAAQYALSKRAADRADDPTPTNFVKDPNAPGGFRPIGPADPAYQAALAKAKAEAEASVPGAISASLNPVFGVGPDGKPAMVQTTKTGKAIQTELPTGFQISKEPIKVDSSTGTTLLDPQTRQTIGFIPKNLAAAEVQKAEGEATGAAQVGLPQAMATSSQTLKTIDELKKHPGLDHSVGAWSVVPNIPGSAGADFAAKAAQLKGQTFLQAYQTLRGSGAITDIEGKKGEDAIGALDRAQSKGQYIKSLNDLGDIIKAGMLRAQAKARGPGSAVAGPVDPAAPAAPVAPQGNVTSSGVKWSIQ